MHFLNTLTLFTFFFASTLAIPHFIPVYKANGPRVPNSYIIKLKPHVNKDLHIAWLHGSFQNFEITHPHWNSTVFHGFAGQFSESMIQLLQQSPDLEYIEENAVVKASATIDTESNSPWGLNRISHKKKPTTTNDEDLDFVYKYDSRAGNGVDIYIVDTGINTSHEDFAGRAHWGATFGGYANADGNGHGTHCAGIAAGTRYGVAKKATLYAVKVLDDDGSGQISDVISGIDWAVNRTKTTNHPSLINLSLGGGVSSALDNSATNAVTAGVHVVAAAGNSAVDAKNSSPARAAKVNTVGATTISDQLAYFSNFGSVVNIYAPGEDVISDWIGSNSATKSLSGTSMATPHVTGLIAYIISLNGALSPAAATAKMLSLAQPNKLGGIPKGSHNELAYNGDGL